MTAKTDALIAEAKRRFGFGVRPDVSEHTGVPLWTLPGDGLTILLADALTAEVAARVAAERERDASDAALLSLWAATEQADGCLNEVADAIAAARARKPKEPGNG